MNESGEKVFSHSIYVTAIECDAGTYHSIGNYQLSRSEVIIFDINGYDRQSVTLCEIKMII